MAVSSAGTGLLGPSRRILRYQHAPKFVNIFPLNIWQRKFLQHLFGKFLVDF